MLLATGGKEGIRNSDTVGTTHSGDKTKSTKSHAVLSGVCHPNNHDSDQWFGRVPKIAIHLRQTVSLLLASYVNK